MSWKIQTSQTTLENEQRQENVDVCVAVDAALQYYHEVVKKKLITRAELLEYVNLTYDISKIDDELRKHTEISRIFWAGCDESDDSDGDYIFYPYESFDSYGGLIFLDLNFLHRFENAFKDPSSFESFVSEAGSDGVLVHVYFLPFVSLSFESFEANGIRLHLEKKQLLYSFRDRTSDDDSTTSNSPAVTSSLQRPLPTSPLVRASSGHQLSLISTRSSSAPPFRPSGPPTPTFQSRTRTTSAQSNTDLDGLGCPLSRTNSFDGYQISQSSWLRHSLHDYVTHSPVSRSQSQDSFYTYSPKLAETPRPVDKIPNDCQSPSTKPEILFLCPKLLRARDPSDVPSVVRPGCIRLEKRILLRAVDEQQQNLIALLVRETLNDPAGEFKFDKYRVYTDCFVVENYTWDTWVTYEPSVSRANQQQSVGSDAQLRVSVQGHSSEVCKLLGLLNTVCNAAAHISPDINIFDVCPVCVMRQRPAHDCGDVSTDCHHFRTDFLFCSLHGCVILRALIENTDCALTQEALSAYLLEHVAKESTERHKPLTTLPTVISPSLGGTSSSFSTSLISSATAASPCVSTSPNMRTIEQVVRRSINYHPSSFSSSSSSSSSSLSSSSLQIPFTFGAVKVALITCPRPSTRPDYHTFRFHSKFSGIAVQNRGGDVSYVTVSTFSLTGMLRSPSNGLSHVLRNFQGLIGDAQGWKFLVNIKDAVVDFVTESSIHIIVTLEATKLVLEAIDNSGSSESLPCLTSKIKLQDLTTRSVPVSVPVKMAECQINVEESVRVCGYTVDGERQEYDHVLQGEEASVSADLGRVVSFCAFSHSCRCCQCMEIVGAVPPADGRFHAPKPSSSSSSSSSSRFNPPISFPVVLKTTGRESEPREGGSCGIEGESYLKSERDAAGCGRENDDGEPAEKPRGHVLVRTYCNKLLAGGPVVNLRGDLIGIVSTVPYKNLPNVHVVNTKAFEDWRQFA